MKKFLAVLAVIALMATLLTSCGGDDTSSTAAPSGATVQSSPWADAKIEFEAIGNESVKREPNFPAGQEIIQVVSFRLAEGADKIALHRGKKAAIAYVMTPEKPTDPHIYWESADKNIVQVDENGNVLGINVGATNVVGVSTDGGLKVTVEITVSENEGNDEKAAELVKLINDFRKENGLSELKADHNKINGVANHRVYEEAAQVFRDGGKADELRPDGSAGSTIYKEFGLGWAKTIKNLGIVYGKKYTADKIFATYEKGAKDVLLTENVEYIGVGYFEKDNYTFWSCYLLAEL